MRLGKVPVSMLLDRSLDMKKKNEKTSLQPSEDWLTEWQKSRGMPEGKGTYICLALTRPPMCGGTVPVSWLFSRYLKEKRENCECQEQQWKCTATSLLLQNKQTIYFAEEGKEGTYKWVKVIEEPMEGGIVPVKVLFWRYLRWRRESETRREYYSMRRRMQRKHLQVFQWCVAQHARNGAIYLVILQKPEVEERCELEMPSWKCIQASCLYQLTHIPACSWIR